MSVSDLGEQRLPVHLGLKAEAESDPQTVIDEARSIAELIEHPGWAAFVARLKERENRELKTLMGQQASENASEYADFIGFLKGLRAVEPTAKAIAEYGKKLEKELAQKEVTEAAG